MERRRYPASYESAEERVIKNAKSFEDLFGAVDRIGSIQGTQKTYTSQELNDLIYAVRAIGKKWTVCWRNLEGQRICGTIPYMAPELRPPKGSNFYLEGAPTISFDQFEAMVESDNPLNFITRTYGLRDKVKELLERKLNK